MATQAKPITPELGGEVVVTPYAPGGGLPHFVQPLDPALAADGAQAAAWVLANRPALDRLLAETGAFVLRGFSVPDTAAFSRMIDSYEATSFGYVGGASPRARISGRVFESTRATASSVLGMHQEMSYLPHYPGRLAFYCRTAAAWGGETYLADMRRYTDGLPAHFRRELERRGVLYTRNFRDPEDSTGHPALDVFHKTWTDTFSTQDRDEAVARAEAMGLGAVWLGDGSLSVTYKASGFATHPATGETLSFHQIPTQAITPENTGDRYELYRHFYGTTRPLPYHPTYGDGGAFDEGDLDALYALARDVRIAFPWSNGDVMILDNLLTAHGRNAYGGHRDVQVALLA